MDFFHGLGLWRILPNYILGGFCPYYCHQLQNFHPFHSLKAGRPKRNSSKRNHPGRVGGMAVVLLGPEITWSVFKLLLFSGRFAFRRSATFGVEGAVVKFGLPGGRAGIAGCLTWEGACGWRRAGTGEET